MSTQTISIPLALFNEIFQTLGAQPTSSRVAPVYEKMREHLINDIHKGVTGEKRPMAIWTCLTPEEVKADLEKNPVAQEKVIGSEKPSPLAMAREFVNKNPDATATDVNAFLLNNFVKPTTASATAYKLFRKN